MSDLRVDTTSLRIAAENLRTVADVAAEARSRAGLLGDYACGVGGLRARAAVVDFLDRWS